MKQNIRIVGTLLTIIFLISAIGVNGAQSSLIVTLTGTGTKTTVIGPGTGNYPSLHTSSSTYDTLFAFQTSQGTSSFYNAVVGNTMTVTQLGTIPSTDMLLVLQKNKKNHLLNNYSGVVIY